MTKWSKLGTRWTGVSVDTLLDGVDTAAEYVVAFAEGDYTTNLPLADVLDGQAWVAYGYDGDDLEPEHGGPARLLVPHLYFWKSAKWVRGLRLLDEDEPGFWESVGYHNYGDPWRRAAVLGRLSGALAGGARSSRRSPRRHGRHARASTCPGWPGHRAGQHVDVRLTAEDGYSGPAELLDRIPARGRPPGADGRALRRR